LVLDFGEYLQPFIHDPDEILERNAQVFTTSFFISAGGTNTIFGGETMSQQHQLSAGCPSSVLIHPEMA
jgi:hypothetical protein